MLIGIGDTCQSIFEFGVAKHILAKFELDLTKSDFPTNHKS